MAFPDDRAMMLDRQVRLRGITDKNVLDAMRRVPREEFVLPEFRDFAYRDGPLPIGWGQTISQPYIVALMTQALKLKRTDRVLEVGTGSGYQAAILAELCAHVYSIERHQGLADKAAETLRRLGYSSVDVRCGDGSLGMPDEAPFDAIVVTAGAPTVPQALIDQLSDDGRLVIPVGKCENSQRLVRLNREPNGQVQSEDLGGVRFVPLIGKEGWYDERFSSHAEDSEMRYAL